MTPLKNPKHEAVIQAYIADKERIGWKAYQGVYPKSSQRAAETSWSDLLRKPEFAGRIAQVEGAVTDKAVEASGISKARVLEEFGKLGFSNMLDYMTIGKDGLPFIDFSALTRDQAAAIAEVHVETTPAVMGDEEGEQIKPEVTKVRFKLADKRGALTEIGKHLGMFKDSKDEVDPNAPLVPQHPGADRMAEVAARYRKVALGVVQGGKKT